MDWIVLTISVLVIYSLAISCYCVYLRLERDQLQDCSQTKTERMLQAEARAERAEQLIKLRMSQFTKHIDGSGI